MTETINLPDYFSFFELPRKLAVDIPAIEKKFYALSRRLHPDRFASRPESEQEAALEKASLLNDAYRTLKDPILRTQHLLNLEGVQLEEQSKAATDAARTSGQQKKQIVPPELLEEVFELNMQLAEMRAARQMGEDDPQLRQDLLDARKHFVIRMSTTDLELENLWLSWDTAVECKDPAAQASTRDAMVALLNKRSYLRNLLRDVNDALE